MSNKFYEYDQNNSGGFWKLPAISVIIEASSPEEANKIAQENGVYFDDKWDDCPSCCGSRWYDAPYIHNQIPTPSSTDEYWAKSSDIPAQLVVKKDE